MRRSSAAARDVDEKRRRGAARNADNIKKIYEGWGEKRRALDFLSRFPHFLNSSEEIKGDFTQ